jgi:hypothetical protein
MLPPRGSHARFFFIGRVPQPFLLASPGGLGLDEASAARGHSGNVNNGIPRTREYPGQ